MYQAKYGPTILLDTSQPWWTGAHAYMQWKILDALQVNWHACRCHECCQQTAGSGMLLQNAAIAAQIGLEPCDAEI